MAQELAQELAPPFWYDCKTVSDRGPGEIKSGQVRSSKLEVGAAEMERSNMIDAAAMAWSAEYGSVFPVAAVVITVVLVLGVKRLAMGEGSKRKLPPGPTPLPFIGNIHQLPHNELIHQNLWHLAQQHGDIMFLRLGCRALVVASSAEAAEEFYKAHDVAWSGRPNFFGHSVFTNYKPFSGIVSSQVGPLWRHARKTMALHMVSRKKLECLRPSRTEEINHMMRSVYEEAVQGNPVGLKLKLGHLTVNNIVRMMLDKRFFGTYAEGEMRVARFKEFAERLMGVVLPVPGDFYPWLTWISYASGYVASIKRMRQEWDDFFQEFIEVKKTPVANLERQTMSSRSEEQKDFVDVLMTAEDGTEKFDDEMIQAIIMDMLIAGTDTTSITIEWTICELLRHPECMAKLQAEIDTILAGEERLIREDDLPHLPYLMAVLKESLRLHAPTGIAIPHKSTEATTVRGYHLPAHTQLFINYYAIHRDPKHWPNPLVFDPERFVRNPEVDLKGGHFQLLPFGAGRRQCPGMALGLLSSQIVTARLVQGFDFTLCGGQDPRELDMSERFNVLVSLKNPFNVLAKPRLPPHLYSC